MENFIKGVRNEIIENHLENNYCIIVYYTNGPFHALHKHVECIYKTVDEFENKFNPDDVDSSWGISFELWIFD